MGNGQNYTKTFGIQFISKIVEVYWTIFEVAIPSILSDILIAFSKSLKMC